MVKSEFVPVSADLLMVKSEFVPVSADLDINVQN